MRSNCLSLTPKRNIGCNHLVIGVLQPMIKVYVSVGVSLYRSLRGFHNDSYLNQLGNLVNSWSTFYTFLASFKNIQNMAIIYLYLSMLFRLVAFVIVGLVDTVEYDIAVIGLGCERTLQQHSQFKVVDWTALHRLHIILASNLAPVHNLAE